MKIGLKREMEFTKLHCLLAMNGLDSSVECQTSYVAYQERQDGPLGS